MSSDRGLTRAPKRIASKGPVLPKETSGGGYKGSGKPTKPKDVKLPFGSGKYGTT